MHPHPSQLAGASLTMGDFQGDGQQGGYSMTPTQMGTPRDSGEQQSLVPVTCKQVLGAESPNPSIFKINGHVVRAVSLVCRLNGWKSSGQNDDVTMSVSDGTGTVVVPIFVKAFLSELQRWRDTNGMNRDSFVRIHGELRTYRGQAAVMGFHAEFIPSATSLTQLMHHYHLCAYVHLYQKYGALDPLVKPAPGQQQQQAQGQAPAYPAPGQAAAPPYHMGGGAPAGAAHHGGAGYPPHNGGHQQQWPGQPHQGQPHHQQGRGF